MRNRFWPPEDCAGLAETRRFGIPIAAGENVAGRFGFKSLIDAGAIDIAQPSVTKIGGIGEMLAVIDLCRNSNIEVVPHCPYFGPGLIATLHIIAALAPKAPVEVLWLDMEAHPFHDAVRPVNGCLKVPQAPGLGCEPDPAVLARYTRGEVDENRDWRQLMKVTRVETRPVIVNLPKPIGSALGEISCFGCILVFVHCDNGVVGENLIFTLNNRRTKVLRVMVEELAEILIGRDAGLIAEFGARAWRDINFLGHKGVPVVGISALDGALWDAYGKSIGQPLFRILGGARTEIPAYHSGGLWLSIRTPISSKPPSASSPRVSAPSKCGSTRPIPMPTSRASVLSARPSAPASA